MLHVQLTKALTKKRITGEKEINGKNEKNYSA
jgi:hypothetical protein